jgi:23S rRNA (adenine2030-N6)-methyltransferase
MNYRHAYHAGNFADVFKHAALIGLLESFKAKQTPFCYIDTHAGRGLYDLGGDEAQKTREAAGGVLRLLHEARLPTLLHVYINLVRSLNDRGSDRELRYYPGSPLLADLVLREQDRAVLCEMHPEEAEALRALFRRRPRVNIHERDGYEALPALLPPKEKRGLVLIDPPFEAQEDEFRVIATALEGALKRWPTGCYAVWYPIKLRQHVEPFRRWLKRQKFDKALCAELLLHPDNSSLRLNGCGLAIINPPWRFERTLEELLTALREHLAQSRYSEQRIEWLGSDR